MPCPVAERSKLSFCRRSPASVAGSNPAGGVDVCIVFCKERRNAGQSSPRVKEKTKRSPYGGEIFRTRPDRRCGPPRLL
jgi:hypothetical protein